MLARLIWEMRQLVLLKEVPQLKLQVDFHSSRS